MFCRNFNHFFQKMKTFYLLCSFLLLTLSFGQKAELITQQVSVENAIRGLCKAFREGELPNSLNDDKYFNVRTMKKIGAA